MIAYGNKGGYPGSNRELTVPHTVALPIELYPPYIAFNIQDLQIIPLTGFYIFRFITPP